jgi:ribosomal protein S18 acetylase RimI-like enzyme
MTAPQAAERDRTTIMHYRPHHAKVRDADPDDLSAIRDLLTEAFLHGDLASWLIGHVNTRQRTLLAYFEMLAEHSIDYGQVEITEDAAAVAVWFTVAGGRQPGISDYEDRLRVMTGRFRGRFEELDRETDRNHPNEPWHQHLALLAVHPEAQRAGRASKLLVHHHAKLDEANTPAFVQASDNRSRHLLARHGYRPRHSYRLQPGGPQLYPLWRPPAPRRPRADS